MKERHPHRIYSNVSQREYELLQQICRDYRFRSIYHLLQTLVRMFLRYANTESYRQEETSVGKEIEEMFDELIGAEEDPRRYR